MNNESELNLTSIQSVLINQKKPLILFVLVATLLATITSFFFLPKQYYAGSTLLPVNAMLTDKSRLFNNNIQELYSVYGTADDLDRIYSIAKAGNILSFLTDSLHLVEHYGITGPASSSKPKAIAQLKKHLQIIKTENGALQIDAWDTNAEMAADITNLLVYKTEAIGKELQQQAYQSIIDQVQVSIDHKKKNYHQLQDSLNNMDITAAAPLANTCSELLTRIERDEKILDEVNLAMDLRQPTVLILEKAYPSFKADKPKHVVIIISAFISSLFFAIIALVLFNRFKQ
ncbi:MAG: Wzz/FepE/Etk N-terminal domain-containing protein [Chitinophagaceae bacterium]